jgi:hypothetical protein
MGKWEIHLDFGVINPVAFNEADWIQLNTMKKDIMNHDKIKHDDTALLCAFIAFLHIKGIVEDTKRSIDDELH